jgi:hypothetical protein
VEISVLNILKFEIDNLPISVNLLKNGLQAINIKAIKIIFGTYASY